MSTRIPLPYSPKVLEIFRNPKNLGPLADATVVESAGSPACGDMIRPVSYTHLTLPTILRV